MSAAWMLLSILSTTQHRQREQVGIACVDLFIVMPVPDTQQSRATLTRNFVAQQRCL